MEVEHSVFAEPSVVQMLSLSSDMSRSYDSDAAGSRLKRLLLRRLRLESARVLQGTSAGHWFTNLGSRTFSPIIC